MESVHAQAAKDKDYLRHLAEIYELVRAVRQGDPLLREGLELNPADEAARRQIRALSASATIARSGLGDAIQRAETPGRRAARSTSPASTT